MLYVGARRSLLKRRGNSAPIWTPAANFPLGTEPGLWYDPGSFTGLYQDSVGTSPATTTGQPNGLMLDKRLGLVLGPELNTVPTNWTLQAGWVNSGGGVYKSTAAASSFYKLLNLPVESLYEINFTISGYVSGIVRCISRGMISAVASGNGTFTRQLRLASGADGYFYIDTGGAAFTGAVSGVSIKALPGNHISQATASARPLIGASGAIQYTTFDGLDDGMSTGAITLGSDMDCFIAARRTAGNAIYGYGGAGDKFFGCAIDAGAEATADGVGAAYSVCVDGALLSGGAAATRGALYTALTAGAWHVIETRNLSLSPWAIFGLSNYAGYRANGDIAGVILCPAGDAVARQKNRQYLGNKVGLVLP